MKVQEAINHANALTGQAVDQASQLRWLSELDGQMAFEMYRAHIWQPYTEDDLGAALVVPYPWDGLYVHHLEAMAYYSRGEYERYNNSLAMRERTLKEFQAFVQRTKKRCGEITIAQAGDGGSGIVTVTGDDVWRYISAYGVALLHGFTGTPEEWLDSLVGPPGPQGEPGETGPKGDKGEKGDTGDTGAQGATGPQGPQGVQGPKGDKGDTGETGATGPKGEDGADGIDGVSPAVTVTDITGGHRVTITDRDHPTGQSFDVLNGSGSGDMTAAVYDPAGGVAQAGGIASFVSSAVAAHASNGDIHTTAAEKAAWDAKADAADIPGASDAAPAMDGTASAGVSAAYSRGDHVHPTDTSRAAASALAAHIADKANPHEVTKAQVGLGSVDNTSDADKPISTAQAAALALKAPLASPALTGTPTAPTAADGTATAQIATTAFVQSANRWQSNPNLLDNCYFVGGGSQQGGGQFPINQRGQTSYTGIGYGIDRWKVSGSTTVVTIYDDYIHVDSCEWGFIQELGELLSSIISQPKTVSFLMRNLSFSASPTNFSAGIMYVDANEVLSKCGGAAWGLFSYTTNYAVFGDQFAIGATAGVGTASFDLKAVKLELGDTQTLAHQENGVWVLNEIPNYQEQLARCQRYLRPILLSSWGDIDIFGHIYPDKMGAQFPMDMRSNPMRTTPALLVLNAGTGIRIVGKKNDATFVLISTDSSKWLLVPGLAGGYFTSFLIGDDRYSAAFDSDIVSIDGLGTGVLLYLTCEL